MKMSMSVSRGRALSFAQLVSRTPRKRRWLHSKKKSISAVPFWLLIRKMTVTFFEWWRTFNNFCSFLLSFTRMCKQYICDTLLLNTFSELGIVTSWLVHVTWNSWKTLVFLNWIRFLWLMVVFVPCEGIEPEYDVNRPFQFELIKQHFRGVQNDLLEPARVHQARVVQRRLKQQAGPAALVLDTAEQARLLGDVQVAILDLITLQEIQCEAKRVPGSPMARNEKTWAPFLETRLGQFLYNQVPSGSQHFT